VVDLHDQLVGNLVGAYQDGNQAEDRQEEVGSPWEDQVEVESLAEDHLVAYRGVV
jgi:hypothetical protein